MRKLGILRGLAIVAVVIDHSIVYMMLPLTSWGFRFGRTAPAPDFTWVDSPLYYTILALNQLFLFSVPLFLFASGYYVAFASRGRPENMKWVATRNTIRSLLGPFAVWLLIGAALSLLFLLLDVSALSNPQARSWASVLDDLGSSVQAYYYVPLLAVLLLAAKLVLSAALHRPVVLLVITVGMQIAALWQGTLGWLGVRNADRMDPLYTFVIQVLPERNVSIARWMLGLTFFFVLGIIVNRYQQSFRRQVTALGRPLIAATLALAVLSVLTANATFHAVLSTDPSNAAPSDWNLWVFLYSTVMVLVLWNSELPRSRITSILEQLGLRSLAIYLIHRPLMQLLDKAIYHAAPQFFAWSPALLIVLAVVGLAGPCVAIWIIAQSPVRRYRKLLVGR